MTVLIIDDSLLLTQGLSRLFQKAGYRPVEFNFGLQALEFVRAITESASMEVPEDAASPPVPSDLPDIVLVDIHLPDISGLLLTQRLRDLLGPYIPIIVLSGDDSMEVINSLRHIGATHFFPKPVSAELLLSHVRSLLDNQSPTVC